MIIATAGHVDHGKTTLIHALTGADTDRLAEEKRRGLTIELGFAWLAQEACAALGFIDVPGHERFIGTMLAGVAGVDMALLVVAADDGIMPQTREHLAILQLLGVAELGVVLTRCDRADAAQQQRLAEQVSAWVAEAGWPAAPLWSVVASQEGDPGVAALRAALLQRAATWQPQAADGPARFMVDRRFNVAGAGCVVTGTLVSGRLAAEQRLWRDDQPVRIRSVQLASQPVAEVRAGQRCALNLAGTGADWPGRGDWLNEQRLPASDRLDISLQSLPDSHWHRGVLQLHLGTGVYSARLVQLDASAGLAQVMLEQRLQAVWNERCILRDPAANRTLGGGRVLDPQGLRRGRSRPERVALLRDWQQAETPGEVLAAALRHGPVSMPELALKLNLTQSALQAMLPPQVHLLSASGATIALTEEQRAALWQRLHARLDSWHRQYPELLGPGEGQLGLVSCLQLPLPIIRLLLQHWQSAGLLQRTAWTLHLPAHRPQLQAADRQLLLQVQTALLPGGLRPPIVGELAEQLAMDLDELKVFLLRMQRAGELIAVAPNRYYLPAQVDGLVAVAQQLVADSPTGSFNAAAYRDASGIGRNLTIQVLEYLDRAGVTRFVREQRFLAAG